MHVLKISEEAAGLRLDKWLGSQELIASRTRAAELIESGRVTLAGKALKPSYRLQAGTEICVDLPPPQVTHPKLLPWDQELDRIFEDADLLVLNKPSGLVVHPAAGHAQDTLVNILLHHVKELSMGFGEQRPGIVHRLDRDTSGLLVVAKNDKTHQDLARQFRDKTVHRIYWALVYGQPPIREKTIRSYLARHPSDRKRFASEPSQPNPRGRLAVTHYRVLQSLPSGLSWLQCQLETGRTHQIRVHLSETGLPLVGDPIYGRAKRTGANLTAAIERLNRLALHACELGFTHPRTGEHLRFKRPWPPELAEFVKSAGFKDV